MSKWIKVGFLICIVIVLGIGGYEVALQRAYMQVEDLTQRYGAEIKPVVIRATEKDVQQKNGFLKVTAEYFKVFEVTSETAKVFVVSSIIISDIKPGILSKYGEFKYLKRVDGNWQIDPARPTEEVWSSWSTALFEKSTWPPYR